MAAGVTVTRPPAPRLEQRNPSRMPHPAINMENHMQPTDSREWRGWYVRMEMDPESPSRRGGSGPAATVARYVEFQSLADLSLVHRARYAGPHLSAASLTDEEIEAMLKRFEPAAGGGE